MNDPNDHQAKEVAPAQPSTVTLRVDETQLSHLLENLKPPEAGKLDLKDLTSLIQVLALVVGGAWALYEFLTFRSEQNRLTLDQQRFAVQQQGLTTRMAELSLSLQKRQEELAGLQLGKAHESRYRLDTGARALLIQHRKDSDEVWIEYTFKITNISDQEFRVTYSVLEVFRGKLAVRLTNEAPIIPVNPPPNLYVAPEPGGVRWQRIHGEAHAYDKVPDRALGILKSAGYKPIHGGGGTFVLKAGESSRFQEDFVIRATPDTLIGFVINWGMDFAYAWNARSYGLRELLSQPQSQRALLPPG